MSKGTALIVGGGIGGLSTALAFGLRGWTVHVLEREAQFGAIGYGIQLGPNVFTMFDHLGITQQILEKSTAPGNLWMYDAMDAQPVLRIDLGEPFLKRYAAPYVVIHRVDLHNVLLSACNQLSNIHLDENANILRYDQTDQSVTVETADRRTFSGDVLIAADGLRSTIRQQMIGTSEPDLIGYVAHRVVVPIAAAPKGIPLEDVILWGGPGFHIVNYPLRGGKLFNIVAVFETDSFDRKGDIDEYRTELHHTYRDAHPIMREMIAMVNLERRWPIGDRPPRRGWSEGRVIMIGDAAHAALQSLAQGACMAIEDATILAALIDTSGGALANAFESFEHLRLMRTARVQLEGRYMWNMLYHTGGIEAEVRNQIQRARDVEDVYRCLDWLYQPQPLPDRL